MTPYPEHSTTLHITFDVLHSFLQRMNNINGSVVFPLEGTANQLPSFTPLLEDKRQYFQVQMSPEVAEEFLKFVNGDETMDSCLEK